MTEKVLDKGVVIGSTAINLLFEDFNRVPKDLDIAVTERIPNTIVDGTKIEFLYNPIIVNYVNRNTEDGFITPDILVTLKASHLFWERNWAKHMYDTQFMLQRGAQIIEPLFYELYDFWQIELGPNKRSDLTLDKEEFFDNAINPKMEIEHDVLHTLINPIPIYTTLLAEGKTVELDPKKFDLLTEDQKDMMAIEEVMVMAYERFRKLGYKAAYHTMMQKFIMNHAPMYLALHIIKNYLRLHVTQTDFIKIIDEGIEKLKMNNNKQYIEIDLVNKLVSNLDRYYPGCSTFVEKINVDESEDESRWEEVHKTSDPSLFIVINKVTDSYGDNERVISFRFARAKEKTIVVYEWE